MRFVPLTLGANRSRPLRASKPSSRCRLTPRPFGRAPMTASMTNRLAPQPGEVINRDERFSFTWNGAAFPAFAGDTIVSALAACGVRVFSRSYKYHRPRGILTADYLDPSCTMQVGDEPNVRGAHRLVEERDERQGSERMAVAEI